MPASPVSLLVGPEELLLRRAADKVLDELRGAGTLEVTDLRAADIKEGDLPDLRTGSLFGDPRAVMIRDAQDLPSHATASLLADLEGPPPEATVILLASGTSRIQKLAKRIKELGGRTDVLPPKEWDTKAWSRLVTEELRRHRRTADAAAVNALLAHAGLDVSTIAQKVAQVAATAPAGTITADHVDAVVVGHGSRGSFAVADAMCDRNPTQALELLSGVLDSGDEPVMVLGALAYRLRSIVAVAGRLDPKAAGVNVSAGQARRMQAVRRNFGPGELTRAYGELARADLEIKSGELPARFVLERAVVAVATRAAQ
ncbi:MAG TPA: DNA polymerase III subunit delta [Egibacteraceae bacterium]|nr:DNA polymerase III subunit delta [Egibacteraceae bacterium]